MSHNTKRKYIAAWVITVVSNNYKKSELSDINAIKWSYSG